jgi:hypothetical protein
MNHHPSDDSANVPPFGQAVVAGTASPPQHHEFYHLNPSLQTALSCLDIKLEDELTRFRSKQGEFVNVNTETPHISHQHDSSANSVIWEQQSVNFDSDSDILTAEIVQPPPTSDNSTAPKGAGFIIIDGLTTSASTSRNEMANVNYAPIELHRSNQPMMPEMDLNFSSGGEIAPFHDEYLSSSQELLRQIQSGYRATEHPNPTQSPDPTRRSKHFTPLKIGSMAVACVLAGGAVYTYLNPGILAPLTATKVASSTTTSLGQLIQSPNLAANEFTELNLSTLNTIRLPTVTATNITTTPTSIVTTQTGASTMPVAIPFNGKTQITPPTTITSQPRLADSLVRALLPANFHSVAKPSGYQATPPRLGR